MTNIESFKKRALMPVAIGSLMLGLASCASASPQEQIKPEASASTNMDPSDLLEFFKAEADNFADCTPQQMPEGILKLTRQTTDSLTEYGKGLSETENQKTLEDLVQSNISKINQTSILLGDNSGGDTQLAYVEEYGRLVLQKTEEQIEILYQEVFAMMF